MNVTYRTDSGVLYIAIQGRLDATNAADAEKAIFDIRRQNEGMRTVIDAEELKYVSSAGLRVVLKLRKEDAELSIINVSSEVYEVLDMTGFTDMVTVHKAYRRLSVDGCEFLAKGANGAVYRYDDETIVKTYFDTDALEDIRQERENARKAFVLGVNTAIPYDIVRVGDGYGTVTELLNARSLSKLIKASPDELDEAVAYYVDTIKHVHTIRVKKGELPDFKEWVLDWIEFLRGHMPNDKLDKLYKMVSQLPESQYLMHGDYHTNNVMIQNGEALLIDMDTLTVGCPLLELGPMFNAFIGFSELDPSNLEKFLGFDYETSKRFWRMSLERYFRTDDDAVIKKIENKAKVIGYTRILRRCIRRNEVTEKIEHYKKQLADAIDGVDDLIL